VSLSEESKKALIKLLEVGVARSSERLAKMSKTEWDIATASTKEIAEDRLLVATNAGKEPSLAARLSVREGLKADFGVFFPEKSAIPIAKAVLREHAWGMKNVKNILENTIGEVSNILAQSSVGALADECETAITLSVPTVQRGTKEALLCEFFAEYDDSAKLLLMSHVELYSGDLSATCSLVMLFNSKDIARLLEA
jgi:chemotaxis protein CheY-P-specific phosphatase CheC